MNSICKHLASHLRLEKQVRVHSVKPAGNQLELFDDQGVSLGQFDRLVVSAPAEQSAEILSKFPKLSERAAGVKMSPCWATMVALPESVNSQWVGAFIHDSFLSWAAKNDTKPGRSQQGDQFVTHASPEWTAEHWEHDPDQVASLMLEEFFRVTDWHPLTPDLLQAHRWKYAIPLEPVDDGCLFDEQAGIAVCGDWLSNARVEGAFLSGMSAAGRILGTLSYEAATDRQGSNIESTYQS